MTKLFALLLLAGWSLAAQTTLGQTAQTGAPMDNSLAVFTKPFTVVASTPGSCSSAAGDSFEWYRTTMSLYYCPHGGGTWTLFAGSGALPSLANNNIWIGNGSSVPTASPLAAPSVLQNYLVGKFPTTAAPGSITGNEPLDIVVDSTNHNVYICGQPAGTAAPACTTVSLASWIQLVTLAGTQAFTGANTFSGALNFTGLSTGTQVSCIGLTSGNAVVLATGACGSGSGGVTVYTGSGAPGSVSGNIQGSIYLDTVTNSGTNMYECFHSGSAPACTTVAAGNWVLVSGAACGTGTLCSFVAGQTSIAADPTYIASQIQTSGAQYCATGSDTNTAYLCALNPSINAAGYQTGMTLQVNFDLVSGASPTLAVNGLSPLPLQWNIAGTMTAVAAGNITTAPTYMLTAIGSPPSAWEVTPTLKNTTTITNCSSSASPAVCGSAGAGSVVIATSATSVVVDTTAVTANSQIFVQPDTSLGTKLSVTCNADTTLTNFSPVVTARTPGTSFTFAITGSVATNPACYSFFLVN